MSDHYLLLAVASAFLSIAMAIYFSYQRQLRTGWKIWPIYASGYFAATSLPLFGWWLGDLYEAHKWVLYLADFVITFPATAICVVILQNKRHRVFPVFSAYCVSTCLSSLSFSYWHNYGLSSIIFYLSWLLPAVGNLLQIYVVVKIFSEACRCFSFVMTITRWIGLVSALIYSAFVAISIVENHAAHVVSYVASPSVSYNLLLSIPSVLLWILLLFKQVFALPLERTYLLVGLGLGLQSAASLASFAIADYFKRVDIGIIVLLNGLQGMIFILYYFAMSSPVEIKEKNIHINDIIFPLKYLISLNKIFSETIQRR